MPIRHSSRSSRVANEVPRTGPASRGALVDTCGGPSWRRLLTAIVLAPMRAISPTRTGKHRYAARAASNHVTRASERKRYRIVVLAWAFGAVGQRFESSRACHFPHGGCQQVVVHRSWWRMIRRTAVGLASAIMRDGSPSRKVAP